ncbi:hypothetical protein HDU92_008024, partial [Lobulomyces angularis]
TDKKYPKNKLILWNEKKRKIVFEINSRSEILNVKLKKGVIIIILKNKVDIYKFSIKELPIKVFSIDTTQNLLGLCSISKFTTMFDGHECLVLAVPGKFEGQIQVLHLPLSLKTEESEHCLKSKHISPHESAVQCITISNDGKILATASEKGTVIRLYCTKSLKKLNEIRINLAPSIIYSVNFDLKNSKILCTTDKGATHMFNLKKRNHYVNDNNNKVDLKKNFNLDVNCHSPSSNTNNKTNQISKFFFPLSSYLSSIWSNATFFQKKKTNFSLAKFNFNYQTTESEKDEDEDEDEDDMEFLDVKIKNKKKSIYLKTFLIFDDGDFFKLNFNGQTFQIEIFKNLFFNLNVNNTMENEIVLVEKIMSSNENKFNYFRNFNNNDCDEDEEFSDWVV